MVAIVEQLEAWIAHYKANFEAQVHETGNTNFKIYEYVRNQEDVSGPALDISDKKLLFVTSSGAYIPGEHDPFDAPNPLGDYRVLRFPLSTPFAKIAFAHDHYNHKYVDVDPGVVLPLRLLEQLAAEGVVGAFAPQIVSFSGYMPDVERVVNDVIPEVLRIAREQAVDAALLVPV